MRGSKKLGLPAKEYENVKFLSRVVGFTGWAFGLLGRHRVGFDPRGGLHGMADGGPPEDLTSASPKPLRKATGRTDHPASLDASR